MELSEGRWAVKFTKLGHGKPYVRMCNDTEAVEIDGETYLPFPFDVETIDAPLDLNFGLRFTFPNSILPALCENHDRVTLIGRKPDGTVGRGEARIKNMVLNWNSNPEVNNELLVYIAPSFGHE